MSSFLHKDTFEIATGNSRRWERHLVVDDELLITAKRLSINTLSGKKRGGRRRLVFTF
jgi:hypothetical protein